MVKLNISVIIPTYNFQNYLSVLWQTLKESSLTSIASEIIFINDGSTDTTETFLNLLKEQNPEQNIKIINYKKNHGRFTARLKGAEEATCENLFFIDSRVLLPPNTGEILTEIISNDHCLMADVKIDHNAHAYSLYWKRTHERIFKNAIAEREKAFYITKENFHSQVTGSTAIIIPKNIFLKHAYRFDSSMVLSDDNALIEKIVEDCPIFFDPRFYIFWEPRNSFYPFVMRMFERGPSFVEFHIFKNQGPYFYIVSTVLVLLLALALLTINHLIISLMILFGIVFFIVTTTALFAQSFREFIILSPIHLGTIISFGVGILWGLVLNSWKYFKSGGTLGYSQTHK